MEEKKKKRILSKETFKRSTTEKENKKKEEFGVSCLDKDTHVLTLVTHCCQHSLQQHSIKMVKNRKNVSIRFL